MTFINNKKILLKKNLSNSNFIKIKKIYNFFSDSFFFHFLRYIGVFQIDYKISTKLNFGNIIENKFIKNLMKKCNFYLEFGSGNSTLYFQNLGKKFLSIETDRNFYYYLKNKIFKINNYKFCNMGIVKYYSRPFNYNLKSLNVIKFYNKIFVKLKKNQNFPDLILVDGRYRVLTCLMLYKFLIHSPNSFNLIIDDFKNRSYYHILNKFFKIKQVGRFGFTNQFILHEENKIKKFVNFYSRDPR